MGFKEDLEQICGKVDGSFAASVMGFDGIPIETHESNPPVGIELATLLVEYSGIIQEHLAVRSGAGFSSSWTPLSPDAWSRFFSVYLPAYRLRATTRPSASTTPSVYSNKMSPGTRSMTRSL